ncbi:MAG: MFS transporter [Mogibacterium sp.]|nr:MFS transporter [Mogibacterium sp.]
MKSLKLNLEYASTLGAYWMIYGITGSFASVFMLAKGYDNMHIGITLAAANLLALGMQPFVADHMDRAKGIKIIDASAWMTLLMMLTCAGYFVFAAGSFMLATAIAAVLAIHALLQPLLNSLAFRLGESGTNVNFGIGRAGGSLGFSAIVAVLGTLVEKKGEMSVPVCTEAACLLLIALLFLTKYSFRKMKRANDIEAAEHAGGKPAGADEEDDERIDLRAFIRRNKYFFIMNLGISGLLFSNAILSNYMPQIAGGVGGTTEQTGRILSLMALLEMPTMVFIGTIKKHFQSRTLIKIASIGFTGKIVVCWLAGSVGVLFAAQAFQLVAFALMMPAMVYYVNEIMSPGEAVKGQSLFTMMFTFSTIIASFVGGWILDASGAKVLTFAAALVTAAGAAVVFLTINKVEDHRRLPHD